MLTDKHAVDYDTDYVVWAKYQIALLKAGEFDKLDIEMVVEELDHQVWLMERKINTGLGSTLYYLLKLEYYGKRVDIVDNTDCSLWLARNEIESELSDGPSLIQYCKDVFDECYQFARKGVSRATDKPIEDFPEVCPWTLEQVLDKSFVPEADELVAIGYVEEDEDNDSEEENRHNQTIA